MMPASYARTFFEKFCDALANLSKTSATTEDAGKRKLAARGPYISPSMIQAALHLTEHDPGRAVLREPTVYKR